MSSVHKQMVTAAVSALSIFAIAEPAMAQFFNVNYGRSVYYDYGAELAMIRVGAVALSTALGFLIGWFLSPQARDFRRMVAAIAAGIAVLVLVFNNGALGWSTAFFGSIIGFCVALGYWLGRGVRAMMDVPKTFGSAKWADIDDLWDEGLFEDEGLIIGTAFDGEEVSPLRYSGELHGLTLARTRDGKGTSQIVPNLLTYEGSVVVIDPKGENALITGKAREEMGHEVHYFDPWDVVSSKLGVKPSRYNPLKWLNLSDPDAPENAMILANAIVLNQGKSDPIWPEESKAIYQGLMLHCCFDALYAGRGNLGTVRDMTLGDADQLKRLFTEMANSPHQLIASAGSRSLQKDPKLLSNVLSSAQSELHMMDSARLREAMSDSDFDFADLKKKPMTIYIIFPADRIETFSRAMRLIIEQSLTVNARNIDIQPEKPVLFILDEMPALGRLPMVQQAYGLMAGFGVKLWCFAQNLSQLREIYGEATETFIANSGVISYFGTTDKTTADYFSDLCGMTTVWNFSTALSNAFSSSSGVGGGSSSTSRSETDTRAASQRKLAYPDELMRLRGDRQLLFVEEMDPIIAGKLRWYEDPDLAAKGNSLKN